MNRIMRALTAFLGLTSALLFIISAIRALAPKFCPVAAAIYTALAVGIICLVIKSRTWDEN